MSILGIRGLENVSKKKDLSKKNNFFRKCFDCSKKFRKKNSTSKLIFLLRSKKIHFEVNVFHFEVKKSTSKLKIFNIKNFWYKILFIG